MPKPFYTDLAFKSELGNWQTPNWLFELLDRHFSFQCDVCANDTNYLCENYFTIENSCLEQDWYTTNFMNPPYGRSIQHFIKKAHDEWYNHGYETVALLPARTDTKWFQGYIYHAANFYFIGGRLRFNDQPNSAPFPSMIVYWGEEHKMMLNYIWDEVQKGRNEQSSKVRK